MHQPGLTKLTVGLDMVIRHLLNKVIRGVEGVCPRQVAAQVAVVVLADLVRQGLGGLIIQAGAMAALGGSGGMATTILAAEEVLPICLVQGKI
jgi:hypothetical protein